MPRHACRTTTDVDGHDGHEWHGSHAGHAAHSGHHEHDECRALRQLHPRHAPGRNKPATIMVLTDGHTGMHMATG